MKNNSRGFSLMEVLIALGVSTLFVGIIFGMLFNVFKMKGNIDQTFAIQSDMILTSQWLEKYLQRAGPSFNNIVNQPDYYGNNFFDLHTDVATDKWSNPGNSTAMPYPYRYIYLGPPVGGVDSPRLEFVFLVTDPRADDISFYEPTHAYSHDEPGNDPMVATNLTYRNLNQDSLLSTYNPNLWVQGELVWLHSPLRLRYIDSNGNMDFKETAKEYSMVGKVTGDDLKLEFLNYGVGRHISNTNPIDRSDHGGDGGNCDKFLKKIPAAGGSSPVIMAEAVQAIKFRLVDDGTGYFDFYIDTYKNGSFGNSQFVSHNIERIVLIRESISQPIIYARIFIKSVGASQ